MSSQHPITELSTNTAIVFICVHGLIPIGTESTIDNVTFTINPKANQVLKMSLAPPGVSAVISGSKIANMGISDIESEAIGCVPCKQVRVSNKKLLKSKTPTVSVDKSKQSKSGQSRKLLQSKPSLESKPAVMKDSFISEDDVRTFQQIIYENPIRDVESSNKHTRGRRLTRKKRIESTQLPGYMKRTMTLIKNAYTLPTGEDYTDETHTFDLAFKIFNMRGGDTMINKNYGLENPSAERSAGVNWKISLLNRNGTYEDLTKMIKIKKRIPVLRRESVDPFYDPYNISTEDIIDYLVDNMGYKNVLIYDFSCSMFCGIDPAGIRRVRREITNSMIGYGGNKKTRKRHK